MDVFYSRISCVARIQPFFLFQAVSFYQAEKEIRFVEVFDLMEVIGYFGEVACPHRFLFFDVLIYPSSGEAFPTFFVFSLGTFFPVWHGQEP